MSLRLKGKVAVITGGASGIGAATARLFVQEGASVLVADRQQPLEAKLVDLLAQSPDRTRFARTDVTREEDIRSAVAAAFDAWGRLDIAVACAGVPGQGSDVDLAEEEWDRIMAVNAKGVFLLTKHAIPEMLKSGGGSIINISSAYGIIGAAAVRTFTKATAIEHAGQGIRANSIHPGVIETPMLQGIFDGTPDPAATRAMFSAQQPNGFNGSPEDIGWGCVYLASDESRFVNGVELPIDGGLVAR
jgi:NAD(P)-dependent dehydrogenase (short-subunit alcohol dehydrogenase family)